MDGDTPIGAGRQPAEDPKAAGYRRMPASERVERAVLGAVLVNNTALERVGDFLRPEHFFFPAHGRIYTACQTLHSSGRVADPLTLQTYFERDDDLADVGGSRYLIDLAADVTGVIDVEDYARTLHDHAMRRQLIGLGEDVVNAAYTFDVEMPASKQIEAAEECLYKLADHGDTSGGFRSFDDVAQEALRVAGAALNRDTRLTGVTTGLHDLDKLLGGLQRSDLLILAGRPAMGKSALATNIAFNAARAYREHSGREGAVAVYFSLEMSSEQLATRILSDHSEIPSELIRKGAMRRDDFPRLTAVASELHRTPLFIDDTAGLSLSTLRTRTMRLKRKHDLGLVVIDYLQLMRPSGQSRPDNRVQEISEITRGLKILAKELDVPVLALSQLSRQVEQREDKRPQLADLRESGSIEQDADVVMFIFREAYYVGKAEPPEGTPEHEQWQTKMADVHNLADVIVAKQRHGPTRTVRLHFDGNFTRFTNLESRADYDG